MENAGWVILGVVAGVGMSAAALAWYFRNGVWRP